MTFLTVAAIEQDARPRMRDPKTGDRIPHRYTAKQAARINRMLLEQYAVALRRGLGRFRVLPLDQLRGLPRVTDESSGCGVYFLWKGSRLRYIGKSNDIGYRLLRHARAGKKFTHATLETIQDQCARRCEQQYVQHYRPPLNQTRHG